MKTAKDQTLKSFIKHHFRHFNAAVIVDAAEAYVEHLDRGGKMFLAMAGAMSTGELGLSLAEMIRSEKIHGISTTGANLEEDLFNLIAHQHYRRIPGYRTLSAEEEVALHERKFNRVTDTCIPEEEAMRRLENSVLQKWQAAEKNKVRFLPHEYLYQILRDGDLKSHYQINPKNSWMVAASEKNLPLFVPGWEDSTLGNMFVSQTIKGGLKSLDTAKSGLHYMKALIEWYQMTAKKSEIGFFQIGGGIAGDFPICAVPLIRQDLKRNTKLWAYFCQISDSTTSYGSYSGAVPNEKITWGKLGKDTPRFVIESDATIVAPLMFAYVLGW